MKNIEGLENIYIFNSERKLIYVQEFKVQNTQIYHPEALSDFLSLVKSLARSLGEDEISSVEIGNSVIFTLQDKVKGILFVIKSEKTANRKKIVELLKTIMNEFILIFDGNFIKPINEKEKLMQLFIIAIGKICGASTKVTYFLDEVRIIL
ncbi:MAG: hypothetical protein ACFFBP_00825 [Promethearchaeota archaeon]